MKDQKQSWKDMIPGLLVLGFIIAIGIGFIYAMAFLSGAPSEETLDDALLMSLLL